MFMSRALHDLAYSQQQYHSVHVLNFLLTVLYLTGEGELLAQQTWIVVVTLHALGFESSVIEDNQFSSSSIRGGISSYYYYPPWQARLGSDVTLVVGREGRYWRPSSNTNAWIQVCL